MSPVGTKRLFCALELPFAAIEELARLQARLQKTNADVLWVTPPSRIHVTLKFLGETPAERILAVREALERLADDRTALETSLDKPGAFPSLHVPQILWAGLTDADERIKNLAGDVDDALAALGIAREKRPFRAHATLGRVRSGKNRAALITALEKEKIAPLPLILNKMTLFESTLTKTGPIHTPLSRFTLR